MATLLVALAVGGTAAAAPQTPPPAIVRIMAAEDNGASFGSGALVAVDGAYGLVVTNWHVVRDSNGFIVVNFPDGFRSMATVVQADRDWDLAALVIQRPPVAPIPLAAAPPQIGDWLMIAGYGSGDFRAASGRCSQYLSPGGRLPNEIVELTAVARQGDSGGPILNARGELAGVLFGANWTHTMGSYSERVRLFLASSWTRVQQMPGSSTQTMLASQTSRAAPNGAVDAQRNAQSLGSMASAHPAAVERSPFQSPRGDMSRGGVLRVEALPGAPAPGDPTRPPLAPAQTAPAYAWTQSPPREMTPVGVAPGREGVVAAGSLASAGSNGLPPARAANEAAAGAKANAAPAMETTMVAAVEPDRPAEQFDQVKTYLAVIGAVLLVYQVLRLLARAVG